MREMLGMEKNKNILSVIAIGCIIFVLVGAYLFFFNSPKQVFVSIVNNINNKGLSFVKQSLQEIYLYNKDFVANVDVEYYIEKEKIKEEQTVTVNKKTGKESIVVNKVPYTEILSNVFNAKINRNAQASFDKLTLTVSNNNEENIYDVYYKNGMFALDVPTNEQFVKLNDEAVKYGNVTPKTLDNLIVMYERIYTQLINQLREDDLYKIATGSWSSTDHKCGLSVSDKRLNEILVNALKDLSNDDKYITAYIDYKKAIDINSTINKNVVQEMITTKIEEMQRKEPNENIIYEIVIYTSGIFNENITQIEMFELENNDILKSVNIQINGKNIDATVQNNGNIVCEVNIVNNDNGHNVTIKNNKCNLSISYSNYSASKEIIVSGTVEDKNITGKYFASKFINQANLENEIYFNVNNGNKDILSIKLKNSTNFESVIENIPNKTLAKLDLLEVTALEHLNRFRLDITDKLGVQIH